MVKINFQFLEKKLHGALSQSAIPVTFNIKLNILQYIVQVGLSQDEEYAHVMPGIYSGKVY